VGGGWWVVSGDAPLPSTSTSPSISTLPSISVSSWRHKLHRTLSSPAKSLSRLASWRPGSPNQRDYNGSKFAPSRGGRQGHNDSETGTELPRWGWGRRKAKEKQQGRTEEKDGASSSSSSTPVQSFRSSRNPLDSSFSKSISSHSGSVDEGQLSLDKADVVNVHRLVLREYTARPFPCLQLSPCRGPPLFTTCVS
jgi:hypothetical protein